MGLFDVNPLGAIGGVVGGLPGWAAANLAQGNVFGGGGGGDAMANYWGPDYAAYNPGYDASKMATAPEYQKKLDALNLDKSALNAYQEEALRKGPSGYAQLAQRQQEAIAKASKDQARGTAAGGTAEAESQLARSGGLSSGARERVARSGNINAMNLSQDANANLANNALTIGQNDEQNRTRMLGEAPGMQLQTSTFDLGKLNAGQGALNMDVNRQIQENQSKQGYDVARADFEGKKWAARNSSMAMSDSPGGTWLCTEAHYSISELDKRFLKLLREYALNQNPDDVGFYLRDGHELVRRMKEDREYFWLDNVDFVKKICRLVEFEGLSMAFCVYEKHVHMLLKKYWPECPVLNKQEVA